MPNNELKPCIGSSALVPDNDSPTRKYIDASPGCWAVFGQVLAKEFSDITYFPVHNLTTPKPLSIRAYHLADPSNRWRCI
ncbi:MAG: hypothetical protein H0T92_19040 [Pyrinomonadaceae bacterium]|nr:hypothetical protein [Pyrinomonadaceae bacterium]